MCRTPDSNLPLPPEAGAPRPTSASTPAAPAEVAGYTRSILEAMDDGFILLSTDGRIRDVNSAVCRMSGYSREELLGQPITLLSAEETPEGHAQHVAEVRSQGHARFEVIGRDRGGGHRTLEVSLSPLLGAGEPLLAAFARDVTERKRMEAALQASEARLNALIEAASDVIAVIDAAGVIRFVSPSVTRVLGYDVAEVTGTSVMTLLRPEDLARARELLALAMTGERVLRMDQYCVRHKDGSWREVEVIGRHLGDGTEAEAIVLNVRDVTDRKQAERALQVQRDLAAALLSARSLQEGLSICLDTALRVEGMDGGGIYLLDPAAGGFDLACARGLSDEFTRAVSQVAAGSPRATLIMAGQPAYTALADPDIMPPDECAPEGFRALAVVPVAHQGQVIACLNIVSRTLPEIPMAGRSGLEAIGAQVGGVIARLQAEEAVRRSEARLSALIEAGSDIITVLEPDGTIRFSSPSATRILGYSAEELRGTSVFRLVHPDDLSRAHQGFAIRAEEPGVGGKFVELRIRHRDGSWRDVEVIGYNPGEGSAVGGVVLNTRDITARKRAVAALAESEAKYRELVENANSIILKIDKQGRVTFFNEFAQRFFGFSEAEILGRSVVGTIVPETEGSGRDLRSLMAALAVDPDAYADSEQENTTRNGRRVWVQWTNRALTDGEGRVVGVLCVGNDVTDRKRAEEELAARTQVLDATLAASPVGIALLRDRRMVWANDAMAGLVGFDVAQGPGLDPRISYADQAEYERVGRELYGGPDGPGPGQVDTVFVHPDGSTVRVHLQARALVPGDPSQGYIVTASDITWRERAEQSQRLAAVGQLAGGVAHDFNNVLTGIIGFTQFAGAGMERGSGPARDLEQVEALADRAAGLVRQLLAFSRQQPLEPVVLSLNGVVANLLKMLRRLIGEDIELVFSPAADLGTVRADPGQMEQVLINLAVNARDAMPTGGRLAIETANVVVTPGAVARRAGVAPGAYVGLTVSDTGSGMDEATQVRVFEPFFTTKEVGKGTGLGLATVYGIVTQHGGGIAVHSEPGRGTTFTIHLPRAEIEAEGEGAAAPVPSTRGHETILLVEDEKAVRAVALRMLEAEGYAIHSAASPREAEEVFAAHADEIALLLTDVVMPAGSGVALYESLRAQRPSLRVLFMSGHADHAALQRRPQERDVSFLQKPFTAAALTARVREVLDAATPPSS